MLLAIAHDHAQLVGPAVDDVVVPVHRPTVEDGFVADSATHTAGHPGIITPGTAPGNGPDPGRRLGRRTLWTR